MSGKGMDSWEIAHGSFKNGPQRSFLHAGMETAVPLQDAIKTGFRVMPELVLLPVALKPATGHP